MEIKIPKEVRQHRKTIFFGLSTRQFICAVLAVGAAPVAFTGFFHYNGLTFEQFVCAFIKSELLCSRPRLFRADNLYFNALRRKENKRHD